MERVAKYLIAQHVADPIRNEARNVGVFVAIGNEWTARFIGETGAGKIDGNKIRSLQYPDVYRQWVTHWWSLVKKEAPDSALLASSKDHYRVIEGGEVAQIGSDNVHDVANYLYASLVSEGNLASALGGEEDTEEAPLAGDISRTFAEAAILSDNGENSRVPNPIRRGVVVTGTTSKPHHPSFVQNNGQLLIADAVDMTTARKAWARDRAGLLAFMFSDIVAAHPDAKTVAIVRATAKDETDEKVSYALSLLERTSRVVNWLSDRDRNAFVDERITAAMHS